MRNVIFIAPPAAGKGTISDYLVNKYGYIHISTGDLLRNIASEDTELGKKIKELMSNGEFIKDEIVLEVLESVLSKLNGKLFLLDGVPRNLNQAIYLTEMLKKINVDNYVVININIEDEILEKRVIGRRICSNCKLSYNINFLEFKPKIDNICDKCGSELISRMDDNIDTFRNRLEIYKKETLPLVEYYKEKNLLVDINGDKKEEEILNDVSKVVEGRND